MASKEYTKETWYARITSLLKNTGIYKVAELPREHRLYGLKAIKEEDISRYIRQPEAAWEYEFIETNIKSLMDEAQQILALWAWYSPEQWRLLMGDNTPTDEVLRFRKMYNSFKRSFKSLPRLNDERTVRNSR